MWINKIHGIILITNYRELDRKEELFGQKIIITWHELFHKHNQ